MTYVRYGNSDCRLCRGDRWVRMTSREINQDEEFERLMDFVFGPLEPVPEPEGFGAPGPSLPPECKWCPECKEWDAGWDSLKRKEMRTELMALRILAKRTERGEKFSGDRTTRNSCKPLDYLDIPLPKPKIVKPKTSKVSLSEQLTQLAALRESGALTAQEFKLAKERLLGTSKTTAKGKSKKKKGEL